MKKKYNVIIIGAGMGGLAAGTLLAKKGYKVLLLEQCRYAGGYCSSFKRGNFLFDSAAHVIGSCNNGGAFRNLINSLNINIEMIRLSPTDRIRIAGEQLIEVPTDYKEYENCLKDKFSKEADNISKFFTELHRMTNPIYAAAIVKKNLGLTYQKYLDSFFTDLKLKAILSTHCGFVGLPPNQASALSALFTLKMFIVEGAYYPRGGAQSLPNAFVSQFQSNGGDIFFNKEVKKILLERDKVTAVMTKDDELYHTDVIISNVDPYKTYYSFIGHKEIKEIDGVTVNKLEKYKNGMSCFLLYLGVGGAVDTKGKNGWLYDSTDINNAFNDLLYLHIPTNYDNGLSDVDKKIIILVTPYNKTISGNENWGFIKTDLVNYYLKKMKGIFPNLSENIITMDAATPSTLSRYTSNRDGSAYGWKQLPEQVYINAFPSNSKIKGLFLAGHWTFPGGGVVSAALSGINAAHKVTRGLSR